jgi:molecular chaperone GrpE
LYPYFLPQTERKNRMIEEIPPTPPSAPPSSSPTPGEMSPLVAEIAELKAKLEEAERTASAVRDQQLRAMAELDNMRKRTQREIDTGVKYGMERMLSDLLTVCDSLDLGLKAATAPEATVKAIADGVALTHKQFMHVLEKHGVKQIDPQGQPFNPDLHEAVAAVEAADVPANHVVNVMQKGYRLHERTLRPAMVVVAKASATAQS